MYIMIFFDLPTFTKNDKRQYLQFRKFLINEGFFMIQYSIYMKVCHREKVKSNLNRVANNLPQNGNIRSLEVTEKQYQNMKLLLGKKKKNEKIYGEQLSFF